MPETNTNNRLKYKCRNFQRLNFIQQLLKGKRADAFFIQIRVNKWLFINKSRFLHDWKVNIHLQSKPTNLEDLEAHKIILS